VYQALAAFLPSGLMQGASTEDETEPAVKEWVLDQVSTRSAWSVRLAKKEADSPLRRRTRRWHVWWDWVSG